MESGDEFSLKFNKIVQDIQSVKIQGAENIAKAGIEAYSLCPTKEAVKKILDARPTEPLLQNALKLISKSKQKHLVAKAFLEDLKKSHELLVKKGSRLIKNDMNIYSHCHSSSVLDILRYAKKKEKKNFVVYTTEVEPLLQGRKTAEDLAKIGIKVIVGPDLSAEQLIKKCDLFLFGADAYTENFLVNKIGTETLCDIAKHHNIPRYSCGVSMKYTDKVKLENRKGSEVWKDNKENIDIENPAFSKVPYRLVSGIISEHGIVHPEDFVELSKEKLRIIG